MPINSLRARLPEAGRIRLGQKVEIPDQKGKPKGRTRPEKLDSFRFSSSDEGLLNQVAGIFGGIPRPWNDAPTPGQFEVVSDTTVLDVYVPPVDMALSQWMEQWSGGGCVRRCDGETCTTPERDGDDVTMIQQPCLCRAEEAEVCKPTTRLGVILAALQSTGIWRLETHGWNAAAELNGIARLLKTAQRDDVLVPATLRVEWRQARTPGEALKEFVVPVLDISAPIAELFAGAAPRPALEAPETPALPAASTEQPALEGGKADPKGHCPTHGDVPDLERHHANYRRAGRPCPGDAEAKPPASLEDDVADAAELVDQDPLQARMMALPEATRWRALDEVKKAGIPDKVGELTAEDRKGVEAILELAESGAYA